MRHLLTVGQMAFFSLLAISFFLESGSDILKGELPFDVIGGEV